MAARSPFSSAFAGFLMPPQAPRHALFLLSPSPSNPMPPDHLHVAHGRLRSPWCPSVASRHHQGVEPCAPVCIVETDRLPAYVRGSAMDVVDHFRRRVITGDVASRAGLQIDQAERAGFRGGHRGFLEVFSGMRAAVRLPQGLQGKTCWQIIHHTGSSHFVQDILKSAYVFMFVKGIT